MIPERQTDLVGDVIGECGSVLGVNEVDEGAADPHVARVAQDHGDRISREHHHAYREREKKNHTWKPIALPINPNYMRWGGEPKFVTFDVYPQDKRNDFFKHVLRKATIEPSKFGFKPFFSAQFYN